MGRKGVILAAGKGTRLLPLTEKTPKPLIQVGKKPFLAYLLERFKFAGCDEVLIVVGHLGEQIARRYSDTDFGLRIHYKWQFIPNGTAHALLLAEEFSKGEPFLMSWSDIVASPENYSALWQRYEQGDCTMATLVNWTNDVSAGADVTIEYERVKDIVEKPQPPKAGWNQSGIFVINSCIFDYLRQVSLSPRGEYEFTDAVRLMLKNNETIIALPVQGYIYELGTLEQLQNLQNVAERLCFR